MAEVECNCHYSEIPPPSMANKTDTFQISGVLHVPPLPGSPQAVESFKALQTECLQTLKPW